MTKGHVGHQEEKGQVLKHPAHIPPPFLCCVEHAVYVRPHAFLFCCFLMLFMSSCFVSVLISYVFTACFAHGQWFMARCTCPTPPPWFLVTLLIYSLFILLVLAVTCQFVFPYMVVFYFIINKEVPSSFILSPCPIPSPAPWQRVQSW